MAAVVIGRNEGQRLGLSLQSVAGLPTVYVDSGSTDGSPDLAAKIGVPVLELDPKRPFSAARGRNEGTDQVLKHWPEADYIMFLDGDCVLDPAFPPAAVRTFEENKDCAIVTGHLTERRPDASVYNRLCAIEWRSPAGRLENMNALGGIMMINVKAFRSVNGFNENAIAGEEPDLGVRLKLAGYSIIKIDQPMATHDADMMSFRQWWTRAVRGGHALAHRYSHHGGTEFKDGRRELISALFWGLTLPLVVIALLAPTHGLSLLLLGAYPLFGWRIYRYYRRAGLDASDARLVSRFILYGKFAHVVGIATFYRNARRGEFRIIEYK